ncbi:unnamed protein product [Bursaphelenchus okinawaensis]|uniref:Ephrin RBD domain-containing protein n=1 Tax=Bursaphelenchus okinawaensis TaxID=465554 RepID=A0A811KUB9_9BILA|nr:unnamed protein product [Bursaphelenchus okinawaensis]CAG9112305.1 unnamed protein product [Bursaphelenchus okinawaensis]
MTATTPTSGWSWLTLLLVISPLGYGKMINVDWSPNSDLFDNGVHIRTIFVRLNDLLKFKCPHGLSLQIHLMQPIDALECRFKTEKSAIGFCSPDTTDPRFVIRKFSPMPDQPLFQEGETYYFAAATNDTSGRLNDGLCRKVGMRLRIFVLPRDAIGSDLPVMDLTRSLWLREQIKEPDVEEPHRETSTAPTTTTTTVHTIRRIHHKPIKDIPRRHQPTRHITTDSEGIKYDVTEKKTGGVPEFSHLGTLPNPLANHLPQLEFEVGYEDVSSSANSLYANLSIMLLLLLRILL